MKATPSVAAVGAVILTTIGSLGGLCVEAGAFDPDPDVIHFGRVFDVETWDFDGDGWSDLAVSDYVHGQCFLHGRTDRTLEELRLLDVPPSTRESGHGIAIGDLNGDGHEDAFLVYNRFPERVLLNDGSGDLVDTGQQVSAGPLSGTGISLVDCDGDGDLDAFVTYYQHGVRLYLNDGAGRFAHSDRPLGADFVSVTPGDIDADGDVDLVGRVDADTVHIVENVDGEYSLLGELEVPGCRHVIFLDADDDSRADLLVVGNEGSVLWLSDEAGGFSRTEQTLGSAAKAAVADVDGDGHQDLAIGSSIWLNDGAGHFTLDQSFEVDTLIAVALIDLDRDDRPELILSSIDLDTGSGPVEVYWNKTR